MSRTIVSVFTPLIRVAERTPRFNPNFFHNPKFAYTMCAISIHSFYSIYTKQTKEIEVVKKYKFTINGQTHFMVVDYNGDIYDVNNSFWYWKWDSVEDWMSLKEGDVKRVSYYGFRIPILGCYPRIVKIS